MQAKVRASPDFYGHAGDEAAAMDDLKRRAVHYEASYQSLAEHEGAFIQLYDLSSKVRTRARGGGAAGRLSMLRGR
eukprot:2196651-Prymnesium_polylepis.2